MAPATEMAKKRILDGGRHFPNPTAIYYYCMHLVQLVLGRAATGLWEAGGCIIVESNAISATTNKRFQVWTLHSGTTARLAV